MTNEERTERREQMRKCLEIAMDIWTLIADAVNDKREDIPIDEIMMVIRKRFEAPLHKARLDAVGYSVSTAINRYGISSCGLWTFAHNLDHCLFEDDLSEIEAAMAEVR